MPDMIIRPMRIGGVLADDIGKLTDIVRLESFVREFLAPIQGS